MYLIILSVIFGLGIIAKIYTKLTCGICKCSRHMVGKVVIVTGGNAGIGYETAKDLAERGARVILACRNQARGTTARDNIVAATGNDDVHYRQLDLTSLASVRAFAEDINKNEKRLDVLVNNAGIYETSDSITADGLQHEMQANHYGPFLLTNLLIPLLKKSAPSRIVNVSSLAHKYVEIDSEIIYNLNKPGKKKNSKLYAITKLCNVLITVELNHKLKGNGVTVNCLHPGVVRTDLLSNIFRDPRNIILWPMAMLSKSPWEGAQTSIYLSVSPEVSQVSGKYFSDCKEAIVTKHSTDPQVAKMLWEVSEKMVKLK